ncbi:hypothetical protein D3C78_1713090 [compost metagenome]
MEQETGGIDTVVGPLRNGDQYVLRSMLVGEVLACGLRIHPHVPMLELFGVALGNRQAMGMLNFLESQSLTGNDLAASQSRLSLFTQRLQKRAVGHHVAVLGKILELVCNHNVNSHQ